MSYLGIWQIDGLLTFAANTHAATGAATDADAVPAYRVYEDETGTAILTGDMAKLDDANTVGFYSEQITLSAANGFEVGKSYTIYISAAVSGVTGTLSHAFQVVLAPATAAALSTAQTSIDDLPTNAELATSQAAADDATLAAIAALNNLSAAQVNAEADTALADVGLTTTITGRIDAAVSTRASQASVDDLPTNAELATSQAAADDATLAAIAALNDVALADIADAVWEEDLSDHSGTVGSVAEALGAAGAVGDPWTTALPGAYGAGSAGNIIGNNINATVSSRATQTSVDDLPTNAELATSQASADDATLAAIAALNNLSAAQVNTEVDTALADYDAPTKAELDAAVAPLATQTSVNDLPTNAELATSQAAADDATLAAIAALNNLSAAQVNAEVDTAIVDAALATAANLATVAGYLDTEIAAILGAVDAEIGTLVSGVAAILADTGTDGVVISQATREAIADSLLGRSVANVEASATVYTLAALVLAAFESAIDSDTGVWTIKRTDGTTNFATRQVSTDPNAEPIVGVT